MVNLIVSNNPVYEVLKQKLNRKKDQEYLYISKKEVLCLQYLQQVSPRYIFFPHWSYLIPEEIHQNYECVIFHMTDLPFGRGGSPLQNLISRGIYDTKITALRCQSEIDAGPVYLKRPISLWGTAEEIYMRAAEIIEDMINWIVDDQPEPIPQQGEVSWFSRRQPEESNIKDLDNLNKLFDYIRMLDAEGYPHAFLDTNYFHLEFERASLKKDYIKADVIIRRK